MKRRICENDPINAVTRIMIITETKLEKNAMAKRKISV